MKQFKWTISNRFSILKNAQEVVTAMGFDVFVKKQLETIPVPCANITNREMLYSKTLNVRELSFLTLKCALVDVQTFLIPSSINELKYDINVNKDRQNISATDCQLVDYNIYHQQHPYSQVAKMKFVCSKINIIATHSL